MEEQNFIKSFISKNKPQFLKYRKYISENNWTTYKVVVPEFQHKKGKLKTDVELRLEEFTVQNELANAMLNRIKYFVKKTEADHHLKVFKDFIKESLSIITLHTERAEEYISLSNLEEIEDIDLRTSEIQFHNTLFKAVSSIEDAVSALNIKEESNSVNSIEFLNGMKAPLSMHKVLKEIYPEINKKLEELKIDFESDPNNELLINIENAPEWNPDKHYWEQDRDTLQFYVDEFKKLENGIVIDDIYISGWAYYHINVFITAIPQKTWNSKAKDWVSKDVNMHPPLRDSDWMMFENRALQEKLKVLFMFIAATRRAAKTTAEASMLGHAATIGKAELLCAGASAKDLGQLAKNFKIDVLHKNPAFAVYNVTNDWDKKVELGIKTKQNKTIPLSTLHIINTDSGNNKEIFAGFTPDLMVLDEAMKEKFLEALEGLLPALRGDDGLIRCYGILSGTGSSDALSADGLKVLNDPETYDTLPMQWDILERGIPEDCITWQEDKLKPFGTFIPGQCRVDMPKIESTLSEYLGKPESKSLSKIKIKVTDWKKAKEIIQDRRDKVYKDKIKLNKEIIYCPITPSEIFMSGKQNRFPVAEAKAHKEYLLQSGEWDRRRELYRDTQGVIRIELSKKELAPFPHRGGTIDAPFLIFEDPPATKPKYGMYSGGFDDYATDDSETSSLASFYVMKNEIIGDPFSNKIVASISFRPEKHQEVYEKWLMLMEAYNLETTAFGENFNYAIKDYLERKHVADKYLAPSLDFSSSFNIPNNGKRKTGWNPSTSKKFLFDLFVDYCNEDFEIEQEDGTIKTLKGVQRIDDIGLLDEIIQWSENLNVDRITSAMGACAYNFFLRSSYRWKPATYNKDINKEVKKPIEKRSISFYSNSNRTRSFHNSGRRR